MLPDSSIIDLAARLDRAGKRVERLETLEFGSLAFPSGGGFSPICDVIVVAPTASVTLCPAGPIPATFKHLFAIIEISSDVEVPLIPDKIHINVNGDFGFSYASQVRQEIPFLLAPPGSLDTDISSPLAAGPSDTKWYGPRPGSFSIFDTMKASVFFMLLPSYTRAAVDELGASCCWFGLANWRNFSPGVSNNFSADQGGGSYFAPVAAPISSITYTHTGGGLFTPPSRFTLYGMP